MSENSKDDDKDVHNTNRRHNKKNKKKNDQPSNEQSAALDSNGESDENPKPKVSTKNSKQKKEHRN